MDSPISRNMKSLGAALQPSTTFTLLATPYFGADGFPTAVRRMASQDACPFHDHPFCEIAFVTGGIGNHHIDRRCMPLRRGSVLVVDAHRPHAYGEVQELAVLNILFMAEALEEGARDLEMFCGYQTLFGNAVGGHHARPFRGQGELPEPILSEALGLAARIERELLKREAGFRLGARNSFLELVLLLSRSCGAAPNRRPASSEQLMRRRIQEAVRHLHQRFREPIDLECLPREFGMSQRNFRRVFHVITGYAPIEYLARIRVHEAAMQLRSPAPSVTQIAMDVGFNDLSFFGRRFKAILGVAPHAFRESMLRRCPEAAPVEIYPAS